MWHVMNYSDITERSFSVKPGKTVLSGRAVFRWEDLHKLENPVTANVAYTLICGPAGKEEKLDAGQFGIQLLPPNHFPMATWDLNAQALVNQTWLIAAWIRRKGPKLQELLNKAAADCELAGYEAPKGTDQSGHDARQVHH